MKIILLNSGEHVLVDNEDHEMLKQYNWTCLEGRHTNYAYKRDRQNKHIKMHRVILKAPAYLQVDHKDGNGLNNQKDNLRLVTNSQNQHNCISRTGTSKYKGVCWDKKNKMWIVQICFQNKHMFLGRFKNEIEAAKTYNKAALKYFGLYANINDVEKLI